MQNVNFGIVAWGLAVFLLAIPSVESQVHDHPNLAGKTTQVSLTFDESDLLICLKATLNGEPVRLVLDTGASIHVYGTSLDSIISGPIYPFKFRSKNLEFCGPQNLHLGKMPDKCSVDSLVMNLDKIVKDSGLRIDGFIGIPFIWDRIAELDFTKHEIRFTELPQGSEKTVGFTRPIAEGVKTEQLDIHLGSLNLPYLTNLYVDDSKITALLDTGYSGAIAIEPALFERLEKLGKIRGVKLTEKAVTAGLTSENFEPKMGILDSLTLGNTELSNIPIDISTTNKIGCSLLNKFHVLIDMRNKRMVLSKNRNFSLPFRIPLSYQTALAISND